MDRKRDEVRLMLSSIDVWHIHDDVWVERTVFILYCTVFTDCSAYFNWKSVPNILLTLDRPQWAEGNFASLLLLLLLCISLLFLSICSSFFFFFLNVHPCCQTSSSYLLVMKSKDKDYHYLSRKLAFLFQTLCSWEKQEMMGGQALTVGICISFSNLYFILPVKQCTRTALSTLLTPRRSSSASDVMKS